MSLQTEALPALQEDQSHILPRGQLAGLGHIVAQVALLLGETLLWAKISNNVIHFF